MTAVAYQGLGSLDGVLGARRRVGQGRLRAGRDLEPRGCRDTAGSPGRRPLGRRGHRRGRPRAERLRAGTRRHRASCSARPCGSPTYGIEPEQLAGIPVLAPGIRGPGCADLRRGAPVRGSVQPHGGHRLSERSRSRAGWTGRGGTTSERGGGDVKKPDASRGRPRRRRSGRRRRASWPGRGEGLHRRPRAPRARGRRSGVGGGAERPGVDAAGARAADEHPEPRSHPCRSRDGAARHRDLEARGRPRHPAARQAARGS